jgi:hypothetical protein
LGQETDARRTPTMLTGMAGWDDVVTYEQLQA